MELRTLKYFLAVARSGSINRASQDLFITQPTISRQMKELEDELGGQIFERSARRRLELTPKGRLLMERAEQIVGLAERTKADLREGRELGGEIAIASGEGRSVKAVTDAAAPFLRENPKVRLCFTSGDADECLSLLDRGICDLALIFTPPDPSRYGVLVLPQSEVIGALVRKDSDLARKESIGRAALAGLPLIASRQMISSGALCALLRRPLDSLHVSGTYTLLYNGALMAASGIGVALCYSGIWDEGSDLPLRFVPLEDPTPERARLIWRRSQALGAAARTFLGILRKKYEG